MVKPIIKDKGLNRIAKNSYSMRKEKKEIRVGLFQDTKSDDGKHTISALGLINETVKYGLNEPRAFMKLTAERYADDACDQLGNSVWHILIGKKSQSQVLQEVGDNYSDEIKKTINTMDKSKFANTPATIAAKNGNSDPLIKSGTMRDSVTARVMGKTRGSK
jgi:hypothetical protein